MCPGRGLVGPGAAACSWLCSRPWPGARGSAPRPSKPPSPPPSSPSLTSLISHFNLSKITKTDHKIRQKKSLFKLPHFFRLPHWCIFYLIKKIHSLFVLLFLPFKTRFFFFLSSPAPCSYWPCWWVHAGRSRWSCWTEGTGWWRTGTGRFGSGATSPAIST
jgi:hypothetical protein